MSTSNEELAQLAIHYRNIRMDDSLRNQVEAAIDGFESRDFYRGYVEGVSMVALLLDRLDSILPQWVMTLLGAYAGKASTMATALEHTITLEDPTETEIYDAFVPLVDHFMEQEQWASIMLLISTLPAGQVQGPDYAIEWRSASWNRVVTIKGARH